MDPTPFSGQGTNTPLTVTCTNLTLTTGYLRTTINGLSTSLGLGAGNVLAVTGTPTTFTFSGPVNPVSTLQAGVNYTHTVSGTAAAVNFLVTDPVTTGVCAPTSTTTSGTPLPLTARYVPLVYYLAGSCNVGPDSSVASVLGGELAWFLSTQGGCAISPQTVYPAFTTTALCTAGVSFSYCEAGTTCGVCLGPCNIPNQVCNYNTKDSTFQCANSLPTLTNFWESPVFYAILFILIIIVFAIIIFVGISRRSSSESVVTASPATYSSMPALEPVT